MKNESRKAQRALAKENKDPQVNEVAVPSQPEIVNSVQKNTFLDRRLNTGFFCFSSGKRLRKFCFGFISLILVSVEKKIVRETRGGETSLS